MKTVACLILLLATPAFGEPSYYEVFDFKKCLHWKIDNEIHGVDLSNESKEYMAALALANRQPYSRHKVMSGKDFDRMYKAHPDDMVVIYSAYAYNKKLKKTIEKYGVCNPQAGFACLPNQDFPLAGARYKEIPSKGMLITSICVAGCTDAPETIYDIGYENMERERNIEQEAALRKFRKICG